MRAFSVTEAATRVVFRTPRVTHVDASFHFLALFLFDEISLVIETVFQNQRRGAGVLTTGGYLLLRLFV